MREPLYARCRFPQRNYGCKHLPQVIERPTLRDDGRIGNTCRYCGGPLRRLNRKELIELRLERLRKAEGGS